MIRFCSSGTSAVPISTPRSPRATMTASDSARISSSAAIASAFSIFAITCAAEPRASINVRRARTSDAERTNESATKSTSSSIANSRSSRSLRVIDGIGSGTPGRLTPLWEETTPPTTTVQRARPRSTASTRSLTWPSSISTSLPTWSTEPSTAGLIGRSPSRDRILAGDDDGGAALERDRLLELTDPELRALQVGDESDRPAGERLRLAHAGRAQCGGRRGCRGTC